MGCGPSSPAAIEPGRRYEVKGLAEAELPPRPRQGFAQEAAQPQLENESRVIQTLPPAAPSPPAPASRSPHRDEASASAGLQDDLKQEASDPPVETSQLPPASPAPCSHSAENSEADSQAESQPCHKLSATLRLPALPVLDGVLRQGALVDMDEEEMAERLQVLEAELSPQDGPIAGRPAFSSADEGQIDTQPFAVPEVQEADSQPEPPSALQPVHPTLRDEAEVSVCSGFSILQGGTSSRAERHDMLPAAGEAQQGNVQPQLASQQGEFEHDEDAVSDSDNGTDSDESEEEIYSRPLPRLPQEPRPPSRSSERLASRGLAASRAVQPLPLQSAPSPAPLGPENSSNGSRHSSGRTPTPPALARLAPAPSPQKQVDPDFGTITEVAEAGAAPVNLAKSIKPGLRSSLPSVPVATPKCRAPAWAAPEEQAAVQDLQKQLPALPRPQALNQAASKNVGSRLPAAPSALPAAPSPAFRRAPEAQSDSDDDSLRPVQLKPRSSAFHRTDEELLDDLDDALAEWAATAPLPTGQQG